MRRSPNLVEHGPSYMHYIISASEGHVVRKICRVAALERATTVSKLHKAGLKYPQSLIVGGRIADLGFYEAVRPTLISRKR